ncbi:hypothetical protein GCM10012289_34380 [Nonomuraea cavernae]|uniref:Uncharacterized protein n=1 Tax=Nonomuraea cavernae TaxID=2045107 RepID=A0A917YYN1_9ACTN|nr:hypothetical protein GCM10012289_34380 [Nonomuraea cavernae]
MPMPMPMPRPVLVLVLVPRLLAFGPVRGLALGMALEWGPALLSALGMGLGLSVGVRLPPGGEGGPAV